MNKPDIDGDSEETKTVWNVQIHELQSHCEWPSKPRKCHARLVQAAKMENGCRDKSLADKTMNISYPLQREDILALMTISNLIEKWPFLFCVTGFDRHFKSSKGKSALEFIGLCMQIKGPKRLCYLEENGVNNCTNVLYNRRRQLEFSTGNPCQLTPYLPWLRILVKDSTLLLECNQVSCTNLYTSCYCVNVTQCHDLVCNQILCAFIKLHQYWILGFQWMARQSVFFCVRYISNVQCLQS